MPVTCNPENYTALEKMECFYRIHWHNMKIDIKLYLHLLIWGEEPDGKRDGESMQWPQFLLS